MDAGSFAIFPVYDGFLLATLGEGLIFRAHRKTILVCDAAASFVAEAYERVKGSKDSLNK